MPEKTYHAVHGEAFNLMKYSSEDGAITEIIWNSRDGVTPFYVAAKDGVTELHHVEWNRDVFAPNHKPKAGDRIFVDITREIALEFAWKTVERFWNDPDYPMKGLTGTKEEAAELLAKDIYGDGTAPTIITVTDEWINRTIENLKPVDILLFCPNCGEQHVDKAEPENCENCGLSKSFHDEGLPYDITDVGSVCDNFTAWLNPPHKSHRCRTCNHVWRPADVPTNGVESIKTRSKEESLAEHRPMKFLPLPGPIAEVK